jgi:hypothetical protein
MERSAPSRTLALLSVIAAGRCPHRRGISPTKRVQSLSHNTSDDGFLGDESAPTRRPLSPTLKVGPFMIDVLTDR